MNQLRRNNRLRGLITRDSEINLSCLASHETAVYGRAFLKNLLRLEQLAVPISRISVPQALLEAQNLDVQRQLGSSEFLFGLIDDNGVLNLQKAGLKTKPLHKEHKDLTPKYQKLSLEDYQAILATNSARLSKDEELGNLFLFKSILRARIDLYIAGEERSAAKRRGEKPGVTEDLQRMIGFFDHLADSFPFGTTTERLKIKEDLGIVSGLLSRKNNPAADAKLASLFEYIEKILSQQVVVRVRTASRARGMKVSYQGKGVWRVVSTGYRKTAIGLLRKETIDKKVNTAELLSLIQHVVDGAAAEKMLNDRFLAQLEYIKQRVPDFFDKLFEIHLKFTEYDVVSKEKACAEMEGALELIRVGTEQSLRLARDMISLSQKDISHRQEEVLGHAQRYKRLKADVEKEIGDRLAGYARRIAKRLADPEMLFDPKKIENLDRSLGAFLGTFLKGEMREDWLKLCKSRVYGLKKALPDIKKWVEVKQEVMKAVRELREQYRLESGRIWRSKGTRARKHQELKRVRAHILRNVRSNLGNIDILNLSIQKALQNGARTILSLGIIHANHHGKMKDNKDFFEGIDALFRPMASGKVIAVDSEGQELGVAYKKEAEMMGLSFKDL